MINILGTYECKADSKGRIMLPSPLKKQIASVLKDGFVIKRSVFNKCLEIHPMSEWKKIVDQVMDKTVLDFFNYSLKGQAFNIKNNDTYNNQVIYNTHP